MAINKEPTPEQLLALWRVASDFIDTQHVICAEATTEDRVYENAPELVEKLAEVVGYAAYDDDDQEELDL